MSNATANGFTAAARSLRSTVLPALPATHATAAEQVSVVASALDFHAQRSGHEYPRRVRELGHYDAMARSLVALLSDDPVLRVECAALSEAIRQHPVGALPDYDEVIRVRARLAEAVSVVVQRAHERRHPNLAAVRRTVLLHSGAVVDLHRSWFAPLGSDPAPSTLVPLRDLLHSESPITPEELS